MQHSHSASLHPARSLRVRAGLIFGLFSGTVAFGLGILLGQLGRNENERQMRQQLSHEAVELAKTLDLVIHERFDEMKVLSGLPATRRIDWSSDVRRDVFRAFQGADRRYDWIALADLDGRVVTAIDPAVEGLSLEGKAFFDEGLSRSFYDGPKPASFPTESRTEGLSDPTLTQVLEIAHPVFSPEGKPVGALCAFLSWDWVAARYMELSEPLRQHRQMEMLVLDAEGRVLLAPAEAGIDGQKFSLAELMDPDSQNAGFIYGSAEDAPTRRFSDLGWKVLLRQPAAIAFVPVNRLQKRFTAAGLGGALLAGLLGWALAGRFTRPVAQLARTARQIADGDPASAVIPSGGRDEVGELASALRFLVETRERQARELRLSFRHVASTFENAAVGMADVALDGRILQANKKLCETLGYERGELLARTVHDLTHPDDQDPSRERSRQLLGGSVRAYTIEKRYLHKSGAIVWVNLSVSLVRDDAGQPEYFVVIAEDITSRKQAEEAVWQGEVRLRLAAAAAQFGTYEFYPVTQEQHWSTELKSIYGLPPERDLTIHELPGFFHPDDREMVLRKMADSFDPEGDGLFELEHRIVRLDGVVRWVMVKGRSFFAGEGANRHAMCAAGAVVDITERHQVADQLQCAKEAAESANRAKDDFLAALSHELRTPLNPVLMLASELADSPSLTPELREDFEAIRKNVTLEARLIDDLLDLTRITRGKLQLQPEMTDAHALLRQAIEFVRANLEAKEIVLELDLSAPAYQLHGDPVRLQQVFWNVLINAVKFTPPGGMIRIRTRRGDGTLVIQVTDSGMGIDADDLARIFNSFAQGEHGGMRFGGLGLGLSISRLLVQMHQGRIWAESMGRGHGATFFIEMPLATPSTLEFPAEPPLAGNGAHPEVHAAPLRLLLVEDHEPTRQTLTRLLQRRGHDVAGADCLSAARELAAGRHFDLLISDLGLPDGSGHELMAEMRDLYGLNGIALSGYGMEEDILRSRAAGFHAHLIKPVDMHALEAAIDQVALPGLLVEM